MAAKVAVVAEVVAVAAKVAVVAEVVAVAAKAAVVAKVVAVAKVVVVAKVAAVAAKVTAMVKVTAISKVVAVAKVAAVGIMQDSPCFTMSKVYRVQGCGHVQGRSHGQGCGSRDYAGQPEQPIILHQFQLLKSSSSTHASTGSVLLP